MNSVLHVLYEYNNATFGHLRALKCSHHDPLVSQPSEAQFSYSIHHRFSQAGYIPNDLELLYFWNSHGKIHGHKICNGASFEMWRIFVDKMNTLLSFHLTSIPQQYLHYLRSILESQYQHHNPCFGPKKLCNRSAGNILPIIWGDVYCKLDKSALSADGTENSTSFLSQQ